MKVWLHLVFLKPIDVKKEQSDSVTNSEYIEGSFVDVKSDINDLLKTKEESENENQTESVLASFQFVKSSIKTEPFSDLGTKTFGNDKESVSQNNDPSTSDSKYYANLFNFNIPKANTVFRNINPIGSIFDQNILDLGIKVEVNDKDDREVQMRKSNF